MSQSFDEKVASQILTIFGENRVHAGGTLRRNHFFKVRDGDFQRGLDKAIENNWVRLTKRDRYTYELTGAGAAEISRRAVLASPHD
jgi:hypothetical protein